MMLRSLRMRLFAAAAVCVAVALVVAGTKAGARTAEPAEVQGVAVAESRRAAGDQVRENAARNFVAKDIVTDERSARCMFR